MAVSQAPPSDDELAADWELAASGELPYKIDPL